MSPAPRVLALVATLLVPAVLSGCTGDDSTDDGGNALHGPTSEKLPVSGGTLLVSGPFNGDGPERITGTPTFTSGNCLGGKNDQQTFVVVWPDGTAVTSPKDDSIVVDGHQLTPGSTFVAHGSFVHQPFPKQIPDIPISCLAGDLNAVAWIQTVDSVEE